MLKMSGDRMMEYWMVPGKLPVLIGEVGGESPSSSEPKAETNSTATGSDGTSDEYGYLNGEDSPFYEPPVDRGYEAGSDR